jgi:ribosomal protein S17
MNPFISRTFPLLSGGRELFGTVIKHGKMDRTVTVKCDFKHWNGYGSCIMKSTSKFLVHNTDNFAIAGDKVII